MYICVEHYYSGLLPCPWPECPRGSRNGTFEINGKKLYKQEFLQSVDEPVYPWVAEGRSCEHCISTLARRIVAEMNIQPNISSDDGLLYHFTNVTAGESIIRSRELWLTDYRALNDATEIQHGLGRATERFAALADQLVPETRELLIGTVEAPLPRGFFVACFSLIRDSPTHWEQYGASETGVAIGIEPLGFEPLIEADPRSVTISRVVYSSQSKDQTFSKFAFLVDSIVRFDLTQGLFAPSAYSSELLRMLPEVLPICKEDRFAQEKEVRLLFVPELSITGAAASVPILQRRNGQSTVEYIWTKDLSTDFVLPIAQIVVGRGANKETLERIRSYAEGIPVE